VVTITEAGIVGKVGFNGNCVGVTLNGIATQGIPLDYTMLPIHFALRYIVMESPSAGEAINRLLRIGVASTGHFLIADAISAYGVEVSPLGNGIISPDSSGFVLHTNHWVSSPERVKLLTWLPDTHTRLTRLEELKSTVHSSEDIWNVLADVGMNMNNNLDTLFGVVMDLEDGVGEMVQGLPARGKQRILLPKRGPLGNAGHDVKRQSGWI
jgi:isopenicillin-N N-acyltransferase-like protein